MDQSPPAPGAPVAAASAKAPAVLGAADQPLIVTTRPVVPVAPRPLAGFALRTLIVLALAGAFIAGGLLLWVAHDLFMLVFAGVLLAVILSWPADILAARTRLPRGLALAVVILGLIIIFAVVGTLMGNAIADQVQELQKTLPSAFSRVHDQMETTRFGAFLLDQTVGLRQTISDYALRPEVIGQLGGVLSSTFGAAANIALVLVLAVFLALSPRFYIEGLVALTPRRARRRFNDVLGRIGQTLQWWFFGQLCSMTAIGVLTFIGLEVLGVKLALTLGILAGLLNFIPNFGPILAAIPALIIAIAPRANQVDLNYHTALYVGILYIAVQAAEGSIITPLIQQRAVALPPALIVVFQVLLALLVGPLGLILATPVLAALLVAIKLLYIEDTLGDHGPHADLLEPAPPISGGIPANPATG